jgi:hypothetical protein
LLVNQAVVLEKVLIIICVKKIKYTKPKSAFQQDAGKDATECYKITSEN